MDKILVVLSAYLSNSVVLSAYPSNSISVVLSANAFAINDRPRKRHATCHGHFRIITRMPI